MFRSAKCGSVLPLRLALDIININERSHSSDAYQLVCLCVCVRVRPAIYESVLWVRQSNGQHGDLDVRFIVD